MISFAAGVSGELEVVVSAGTFNVLTATCGTTRPTCLGYQNYWSRPTDPWQDQSPSTVVKVQITSADITQDKIAVVLSGPPSASGNLNVQVTGPNGQPSIDPITNGTVGPNTYNYSFGLNNIPIGEYTTITATWTVNGTNVTATYSYHFKVMGTFVQSQYNTPLKTVVEDQHKLSQSMMPPASPSPQRCSANLFFVCRILIQALEVLTQTVTTW